MVDRDFKVGDVIQRSSGVVLDKLRKTITSSRFGDTRYCDEPGIYEVDDGLIVKWDGKSVEDHIRTDMYSDLGIINICGDQEDPIVLVKNRHQRFSDFAMLNPKRLGGLPDWPFYEMDVVTTPISAALKWPNASYCMVNKCLYGKSNDRSPVYELLILDHEHLIIGTQEICHDEADLIERGPVWNLQHTKEPIFRSIGHEVYFAVGMGLADRVIHKRIKLTDLKNDFKNGLFHYFTHGTPNRSGEVIAATTVCYEEDLRNRCIKEMEVG